METDVLCQMEDSIQLRIVGNGGHWASTPDTGTESEGGGSWELGLVGRLEVGRTGILGLLCRALWFLGTGSQ